MDCSIFKGEARYRLVETINLVCSYNPYISKSGLINHDVAEPGISDQFWDIIETSEFRAIIAESGTLGYLRHPAIGLRRLYNLSSNFIQNSKIKNLVKLVDVSASLSSKGIPLDTIESIIGNGIIAKDAERQFSPPFIKLGPAEISIARIALFEEYPDAKPPPGTIFVVQGSRDKKFYLSWLNIGEEEKLDINPEKELKRLQLELYNVKKIQQDPFKKRKYNKSN